ncbi:hypothetical protein [Burkholderia ubonensis]|uniref:hypothetical protein n=1 Tax=Burkholderia ubonensis TaxID=101571 RepID=UPI0015870D66|nr:hypothetical protein [Burkholderia ubonensis]
MISHPPTFVLIGLGVALVAMFGFGFYWLATKDRPTRPISSVMLTPARGATGTRVADVDEADEWEAFAPYPDHVVQAAHEATIESHDSYPPLGRHEEPVHASPASEARHVLCISSKRWPTPAPNPGTASETN